MADATPIKREVVLLVLRTCLGDREVVFDEATCRLTVYYGNNPRTWTLAPDVPPAFVRELANRYRDRIAVHLFWHPEKCHGASRTAQ